MFVDVWSQEVARVEARVIGVAPHSTLMEQMQIDIAAAVDCPHAIHRIIPNMWIIICVIHTVIPTMWITRFSIHISRHPRVVQVNGVRTSARTTAGCAPLLLLAENGRRKCVRIRSHGGGLGGRNRLSESRVKGQKVCPESRIFTD